VTFQHSSENTPCTLFHICPNNLFSSAHVCNESSFLFDDWFHRITIVKSSCKRSSQNSSWFNQTDLKSCDAAWRDQFQVKNSLCNMSTATHSYNQTSNALVKPSAILAILWVLGLLSIFGNVFVLANSYRVLKQSHRVLSDVQKIHHIMLINLAIADFLMGVYLICRGVLSIFTYGGDNAQKTVSRDLCSFLGVITVVSCQMSVTVLVLISSFRLYSVVKPFRRLNVKVAYLSLTLSWILWFLFGSLPLFEVEEVQRLFGSYKDTGCAGLPYRFTHKLMRYLVKKFLEKLSSECNFSFNSTLTLSDGLKTQQLLNIAQHIKIISYNPSFYNYFQEQSLCMVKYYLTSIDGHRFYGLSLLAINFTAFMYLFGVYLLIYFKFSKEKSSFFCCSGLRNVGDQSVRDEEDQRLQCRVFFIIATDFLCWVPTAVIAFWYTAAAYNPKVAEVCQFMMKVIPPLAGMTLLLLPINSALNPLVYTSTMSSVMKFASRLCSQKLNAKKGQNQLFPLRSTARKELPKP